jgi:hypothetical protein
MQNKPTAKQTMTDPYRPGSPTRNTLLITIVILLLLPLAVDPTNAQSVQNWSSPFNISQSDTASLFPDIAVDRSGQVYVVWGEHSSDDVLRSDMLMFRTGKDQNWSQANDIATGGHLPQIAVDSQGRLHVVHIGRGLQYLQAWAQEDPANARSWTEGQNLGLFEPYWPDLLVDDQDTVHVVFRDSLEYETARTYDRERRCVSGCRAIFYIQSTDGGKNWTLPIQLDTPLYDAETPHLAVDRQGNLYVAWTDVDANENSLGLSLSYSSDGGETWSYPRPVVTGNEGYQWPQMAVDSGGRVHLAWRYGDLAIGTIGYLTTTDVSRAWSEVQILELGSGGAYSFGLTVDSANNLHLVLPLLWGNQPMGVSHLVRSGQSGEWSEQTRISQDACSTASADAELIVSQGNLLHVVWYDRPECELGFAMPTGRGEIYYSRLVSSAPPATAGLPRLRTTTPVQPTEIAHKASPSTPTPTRGTDDRGREESTATPLPPANAEEPTGNLWAPSPLLVGGFSSGALVLLVVVILRLLGRSRKR